MTWQNALFVAAGVTLLTLVEWGRHRLELWLNEQRRSN